MEQPGLRGLTRCPVRWLYPSVTIWRRRPVRDKGVPVWWEQVALLYSACSCRIVPASEVAEVAEVVADKRLP